MYNDDGVLVNIRDSGHEAISTVPGSRLFRSPALPSTVM